MASPSTAWIFTLRKLPMAQVEGFSFWWLLSSGLYFPRIRSLEMPSFAAISAGVTSE